MLGLEGYKRLASAFVEGCYFEGSWEQYMNEAWPKALALLKLFSED